MKKLLVLIYFACSLTACITINPVTTQPDIASIKKDTAPTAIKSFFKGTAYSGAGGPVTNKLEDAEFDQLLSDFTPASITSAGILPQSKKNVLLKDTDKATPNKADKDLPPYRKQTYLVKNGIRVPFTYSYSTVSETNNGNCKSIVQTFNCTSTSFMNADYENQGQYIYPSAIYNVEDLQNGNYREITAGRLPVTLSTDNPNLKGPSFVSVEQPNIVNLREGTKNLFTQFDDSRSGTMDFRYQILVSNNSVEHQMKISAGGGGSFGPFSASLESTNNSSSKSTETYITVDVIKDLFTINSLPNAEYFATNDSQSNSMVVIKSVTYGIRLLANIDITGHEAEVQSTLNTKAKASFVFSADGHLDLSYLDKVLDEKTKVNCYLVGGPTNATCSFTLKDFEDNISKIISGATANNARPIEYTLGDIFGNTVAIQSSVTNLTKQVCTPISNVIEYAKLDILTGTDDKDAVSDVAYGLYAGNTVDASKINNATCIERMPTLNDAAFLAFPNGPNDRGFSAAGPLVGISSSCFGTRYPDHSFIQKSFYIFTSKGADIAKLKQEGGAIIIKHDDKNKDWRIRSINLHVKFAGELQRTMVWNLNDQVIGRNGTIVLRFNGAFEPQ